MEAPNGQILSNASSHILYVLSGEISMFYINRDEETPNPANLVKTFTAGQLACLYDLEEDDMFETGRLLKMILQCTSSAGENELPTKFLCISKERMMDYVSSLHLQPLKTILQTRSSLLPPMRFLP
jgi:hypothetical protein